MFSTIFLFSFVSLLSSFVISFSINDSKSLKLSANSTNKYVSQQLYVFGGLDGPETVLSSASQFNSSTGEWEAINDMAVGKYISCGAVAGAKIYLFGGEINANPRTRSRSTQVYDCETGTYSEFRSLPDPIEGCGAAVLNGFIYVAGGDDGSKGGSNVVRYNLQTTRRENVSPLHVSRSGLSLKELSGRLYAIGGWTNVVQAYNPTTGRWLEVASTQYAHEYFGAAVHKGKIYVCSEYGFEVYSPDSDQWKVLTPHNDYVGNTLVSMNGRLWALGGGYRKDYVASKSVFVYNTTANTWNKQMDMNVARMFHTAFVVNH